MPEKIKKCTLLIVENNIIKSTLENREELSNYKVITLNELRKKFYYDYDNKAIFYLMKEFSYQYDVAKMYLSHLYEVPDKSINDKINHIIKIKKLLENNNLLITHPLFKEYLTRQTIFAYNLYNISKLDKKMLDEISKISNINYYYDNKKEYKHESLILCNTKEEEVTYTASEISKLLKSNIDIKNIKVFANDEYKDSIERIFTWFNIPISKSKHNLYTTKIGKLLLNNLNLSKEECLKKIKDTISIKVSDNINIYNKIIKILNNYTWNDSLKELEPFLINDLKNTTVDEPINLKIVEIINNLDQTKEEDYVFILGFNQGEIPTIIKDEDYFNNNEKKILNLDTIEELNKNNYNNWIRQTNSIKNLTITAKKNNERGECYISPLNDTLNLKEIIPSKDYNSSNLYNKLELTKKLDILSKYNELSEDIELLYNNYPSIEYNNYKNNYKKIDKNRIRKYINNKLILSYSSMNTYYQCSFKYYLNNILKLSKYETTFDQLIGNLFHHILSLYYKEKINIKEEYQKYIDSLNYSFNQRELFFVNKLENTLEFIIDTIDEQNKYNTLNNILTEEEVKIKTSYEAIEVTFKGYVDKIMTNDKNNIIAIVDYKTGNPNLNLNNIIHGLDLQLPTYLYLSRQLFKDARIAGFYLQKLLNSEIIKDGKHDYLTLKKDKLKLQGYTNPDLSLLSLFDPNYTNSNMIKGMSTNSKGLATKKILDDTKIDKLIQITEEKIKESIQNISNANFDINPKRIGLDNLGCAYCKYKDICFKTEKNIETLKEYKNMDFLGGETNDS